MSWPSDKVLKAPVTEASQRSATEHAHQEDATTAAPKHSSAVAADHSSMPKQGGEPSVATEHSGASQVVSEHSGASQVATEHNVTDQGTSDVNDTKYDDGPIRPCAFCKTELIDDPLPREAVRGYIQFRVISIAQDQVIRQLHLEIAHLQHTVTELLAERDSLAEFDTGPGASEHGVVGETSAVTQPTDIAAGSTFHPRSAARSSTFDLRWPSGTLIGRNWIQSASSAQ